MNLNNFCFGYLQKKIHDFLSPRINYSLEMSWKVTLIIRECTGERKCVIRNNITEKKHHDHCKTHLETRLKRTKLIIASTVKITILFFRWLWRWMVFTRKDGWDPEVFPFWPLQRHFSAVLRPLTACQEQKPTTIS